MSLTSSAASAGTSPPGGSIGRCSAVGAPALRQPSAVSCDHQHSPPLHVSGSNVPTGGAVPAAPPLPALPPALPALPALPSPASGVPTGAEPPPLPLCTPPVPPSLVIGRSGARSGPS